MDLPAILADPTVTAILGFIGAMIANRLGIKNPFPPPPKPAPGPEPVPAPVLPEPTILSAVADLVKAIQLLIAEIRELRKP